MFTRVWLLSSVSEKMSVQIAFRTESFVTFSAWIWFFSRMTDHVNTKRHFLTESFVTFRACIWFFPGMYSHMQGEMRGAGEHFTTNCACSVVQCILDLLWFTKSGMLISVGTIRR